MPSYLENESRLASLKRQEILDTETEEGLDRLTRLAQSLLKAPLSLLSIVDEKRQFFKSSHGLTGTAALKRETPLTHSFCKHVVEERGPLVVAEARTHPAVRDNLAIEELGVESYLGFPVSSPDGHVLGSFCVIDTVPRQWTQDEIVVVKELALQVEQALALRHELKERHRAERELRDILEQSPVGIFSLDKDGELRWLNKQVLVLLAMTEPPRSVDAWFEDPSFFGEYLDRLSNSATLNREVARLSSGREVEIYGNYGEGESSRLVQVFLVDVTEQRVAEWQAREMEALLRESERIESLGFLAGGIAHDFNNILTTISANLELLETESIADPEEQAESFQDMREAIIQASDIVDKMLTYTGRSIKKECTLDLNEVVRATMDGLGEKLAGSIDVDLDLQPLAPVWGNGSELAEVLMNLVVNAREAIDEGGQIQVGTRMLDESPSERRVILEVRDNGEGIQEGHITRIFDPFFTTRFTGRGLGLATVHGIVRSLAGEIQVDSSPGTGTTIRVSLPSSDTGGTQTFVSPSGPERKSRVLVVDDETAVRVSVTKLLERSGFETEMASGGIQALEMLENDPRGFDLVLMDIMMPDLNGVEATARILERDPAQLVVLMSGYHDHLLPDGHSGFLTKPFTRAELVASVEAALIGVQ